MLDDEKQGWIAGAVGYITKQEPQTVIAFAVLAFIGYWMLVAHPKQIENSKEWHRAQDTRFADVVKDITTTHSETIKKISEKQLESQKERTAMHIEEVRKIEENADKALDRIMELTKGR